MKRYLHLIREVLSRLIDRLSGSRAATGVTHSATSTVTMRRPENFGFSAPSSEYVVPLWKRILRRYWVSGIGIAAACLALLATQQYTDQQVSAARQKMIPAGGMAEVLVAARDLRPGELVSPLTVAVRTVPRDWTPQDSIDPVDFTAVEQRRLMIALRSGTPLTASHLRPISPRPSALELDPGHRAVSIAVDEISSIGGLIQPGDRIDLWGSPSPPATAEPGVPVSISADRTVTQRSARLVAENLRVVAAGGRTHRTELNSGESAGPADSGPQSYSSLTLSVPPAIASAVLGGQFQGRFAVALRSPSASAAATSRKSSARISPITKEAVPVEILMGGLEGALQ
jgi:pilus assembly protein CpaB